MAEELPPSLFNILRQDLATTRTEINGRLDNIASQSVSQSTFDQAQANQKERDERQDARLRDLESKEEKRNDDLRAVVEDQRKAKAQLLTSIGLAVFGVILSIIGGVTIWTLQSGLSQLAGGGG